MCYSFSGAKLMIFFHTVKKDCSNELCQCYIVEIIYKFENFGKRLHDDVLHISKKPLRGEPSGFLSICQAEASCISPKVLSLIIRLMLKNLKHLCNISPLFFVTNIFFL